MWAYGWYQIGCGWYVGWFWVPLPTPPSPPPPCPPPEIKE